ncbi:hypothetical protein [Leisingera daeponensis]|uniref:hypothetical protein n=1 Tax=Leisingera daeponensis TaxID=405746 RepID=UPI000183B56F|nr:hypothetical protein [Leisingera daeponensis]EDZ46424.1 conserved hypothetical protein [Rhodobacterales bacterium Y4I]
MAWAGIFLGMIAGLFAAVFGYAAFGLPLWLSLLMYPAAGTVVALAVTVLLAWRSFPSGPAGGAGHCWREAAAA